MQTSLSPCTHFAEFENNRRIQKIICHSRLLKMFK